jgi:sugar diacid utilization regulator
MTAHTRTTTLGMVLTEFGGEARLLAGSDDDLTRPVTGASIVTERDLPEDPGVALILPDLGSPRDLEKLATRLSTTPSRLLVLTGPAPIPPAKLAKRFRGHLIVELASGVDPATVVLSIARSVDIPDETVTRRLASLQHSLTRALGEPEPIVALLDRLKNTCNATVAFVDKRGHVVHSTGPVPLTLIFGQISHTAAETQTLDIDGWHGIADRIHDLGQSGDHVGWLVVVSRRADFPNVYTVSAVHVAAALVEASQRMTHVARQQEQAIRAAVLEEALALRRTPEDPELAGRIISLGLSFDDELRAIVVRPAWSTLTGRKRARAKDVAVGLARALDAQGITFLMSVRESFVVLLVQASPGSMRRLIVASGDMIGQAHVGVGRPVGGVGDVMDSYHDAQLAVQSLRRAAGAPGVMSYEDFDFVTRLFSDVGTDRMTAWAREFLGPIDDRSPLMEGLSAFFEHSQNMNSAARSLGIHHNSLRYRLAKAEEILGLSLRDPAAVSSLYLALAARDLEGVDRGTRPRAATGARDRQPPDVEAPHTQTEFAKPRASNLGVVMGPER